LGKKRCWGEKKVWEKKGIGGAEIVGRGKKKKKTFGELKLWGSSDNKEKRWGIKTVGQW
jgi:hypothetical protein